MAEGYSSMSDSLYVPILQLAHRAWVITQPSVLCRLDSFRRHQCHVEVSYGHLRSVFLFMYTYNFLFSSLQLQLGCYGPSNWPVMWTTCASVLQNDVFQMDWNLLNRHVAKPLLRRELVFKDIWGVYYLAVVLDFLLRFAWVLVR